MRVSVRQTWPYLSVYNNGDDGKSIYEYIGIDDTPSAFPVWTSDLKETIRKKILHTGDTESFDRCG